MGGVADGASPLCSIVRASRAYSPSWSVCARARLLVQYRFVRFSPFESFAERLGLFKSLYKIIKPAARSFFLFGPPSLPSTNTPPPTYMSIWYIVITRHVPQRAQLYNARGRCDGRCGRNDGGRRAWASCQSLSAACTAAGTVHLTPYSHCQRASPGSLRLEGHPGQVNGDSGRQPACASVLRAGSE